MSDRPTCTECGIELVEIEDLARLSGSQRIRPDHDGSCIPCAFTDRHGSEIVDEEVRWSR